MAPTSRYKVCLLLEISKGNQSSLGLRQSDVGGYYVAT